jgi:signal transduction histidine kinase
VVSLPAIVRADEDRAWVWALDCLLVLPLIWRRKAPAAVFGVLAVAGFAQWAAGVRLGADVALLVALYTVAAYRPRRPALVAGAVLEVGVVLAATRFAPAGDVGTSMVLLSGLVVAAFFVGTSVRNRRAYLAALVERTDWLERERDAEARLAAIAERARIARELHDTVAHSLTVVVTLAEAANATVPTDPAAAQDAMGQVATTGRDALAEMRRLLGVLRADETAAGPDGGSDRAPTPGLDRLDELIGNARSAGLPVRLAVSGPPRRLPSTLDVTAYRTVQESLTNALRHAAEPTKVQVGLRWSEAQLVIEVTDDGRPGGWRAPADGHGLTGMRERLAVFGGSLSTGPGANGGWHVRAVVPLPPGPA